DGPDNITVVLARFDGEGLKPPGADDAVAFVPYDPGSDPVTAEGSGPSSRAKETLEERIPRELVSTEDVVTKTDTPIPAAVVGAAPAARTARAALAFFFMALLVAAAGGIFLMKCEHDQPTHQSGSLTPLSP